MSVLKGNLVDIKGREIYPAEISIKDQKIEKITRLPKEEKVNGYIIPGFVDGHVHVESSMLIPSEFARLAVLQGTIATVSDPHEIGNVIGIDGVRFMILNGRKVPFKFYFGAPSCVPATKFETSGAHIGPKEIEELLAMPEVKFLSEMMNFPGVLNKDPEVWAKLEAAKKFGKPVDGHAPGLRGDDAKKYCDAGISTDHECYSLEEAEEKLKYGMKVIIREGSSAKNFEDLQPLIAKYYDNIMLCADDLHPNDLQKGHINQLVKRSVEKGHDLFNVLQIACFNPIDHYKLDLGRLREGDWADIVVLEDLKEFKVLTTYINGQIVADKGKSLIESVKEEPLNNFKATAKKPEDFKVPAKGAKINVIEAIDGSLLTKHHQLDAKIVDGHYVADLEQDLVKIAVVNRYQDAPVSVGFIKGFGIKGGAIACSIAHDSHNITTAGVKDEDIARVVNKIIEMKGGVAVLHENGELISLNLPFGGLMSGEDAFKIAEQYDVIEVEARKVSKMHAPFMTMAFMALLVIPEIKISDKGLFDGVNFKFIDLAVPQQ